LASAPIGAGTILRNAALAAVAAFVVLRGRNDAGASAFAWLVDLSGFERGVVLGGSALLSLLAIEGWGLLQVIAPNGRLLTRLEALEAQPPRPAAPPSRVPIGDNAPAFALPDLDGREYTLDSLRAAGTPVLLVFVDPDCGSCAALLPDVAHWQREHARRLSIAVISRGSVRANRG